MHHRNFAIILLIRRHLRFHQMATYYFYPVTDFHEIDGFLVIAPKPEVIDRYSLGLKCYVPLALSNGIWVRAIGLPVLVGHREVCLFFKAPYSVSEIGVFIFYLVPNFHEIDGF